MITIGVDEVGRGCWAGPLLAGAVILNAPIAGLKDSKKLTRRQRVVLSPIIKAQAEWGLGWVEPWEVDELGLTAAVRLAMERAVRQLDQAYDQIIVDGNYNFLAHLPNTVAVVKADDSVPAVSAASIIAKVTRDDFMYQHDYLYPGYGFASNVGYGTAEHRAGLARLGVCDLHRRSYKPIQALLH